MPGKTPPYGLQRRNLGRGDGSSEIEAKRAAAREGVKVLEADFSADIQRLKIKY